MKKGVLLSIIMMLTAMTSCVGIDLDIPSILLGQWVSVGSGSSGDDVSVDVDMNIKFNADGTCIRYGTGVSVDGSSVKCHYLLGLNDNSLTLVMDIDEDNPSSIKFYIKSITASNIVLERADGSGRVNLSKR